MRSNKDSKRSVLDPMKSDQDPMRSDQDPMRTDPDQIPGKRFPGRKKKSGRENLICIIREIIAKINIRITTIYNISYSQITPIIRVETLRVQTQSPASGSSQDQEFVCFF